MAAPVAQRASNQPKSTPKGTPDIVEAKVTLAIDAYRSGRYSTIKAAAEAFDAPYYRTRGRYQGRHTRELNGGHQKVLTEAMEAALHSAMQRLAAQGARISANRVWCTANDILKLAVDDGSQPQLIGRQSARNFLARNQNLVKKLKKAQSQAQKGPPQPRKGRLQLHKEQLQRQKRSSSAPP
ncbi:hypothetical protein F5Y12DRAFT_618491 [Xylaria sp. FL1777]|nr:hypothetical protein F5Y12DRAFT_618491 [Xylaria sp. FL1777]